MTLRPRRRRCGTRRRTLPKPSLRGGGKVQRFEIALGGFGHRGASRGLERKLTRVDLHVHMHVEQLQRDDRAVSVVRRLLLGLIGVCILVAAIASALTTIAGAASAAAGLAPAQILDSVGE